MENVADDQSKLLAIVETWRISEKPEYRGFRCANCQQYKNEAWYHWVYSGGYVLPIHLCNDTCEQAFQNGTLSIDQTQIEEVDRKNFGKNYLYSNKAKKRFADIFASWSKNNDPKLKAFTCDDCKNDLEIDTDGVRKGWHVWWNNKGTLTELHFCKKCASLLASF